jgi:hypothetical protein
MKKITVVVLFLLLLAGYSCKESFLDVAPTGSLAKAQLTTKAGLEGALIAGYAQLSGLGSYASGPSNWVWGSIRGGDANKGTDPGDFSDINPIQRFEYSPTLPFSGEVYQGHFEGVARANAILALLKEAAPSVKPEDVARMEAEARFLRAHFYFQLKRNFDMVPYVDETNNVTNGIEKVKNDVDLWPKIEADFKAAYDKLPEVSDAVGRANKNSIACSMTESYDPYANAIAERVNGILKQEFIGYDNNSDIRMMSELIKNSIKIYNHIRPHYSCHLNTPEFMHHQRHIKIRTYKKKNPIENVQLDSVN